MRLHLINGASQLRRIQPNVSRLDILCPRRCDSYRTLLAIRRPGELRDEVVRPRAIRVNPQEEWEQVVILFQLPERQYLAQDRVPIIDVKLLTRTHLAVPRESARADRAGALNRSLNSCCATNTPFDSKKRSPLGVLSKSTSICISVPIRFLNHPEHRASAARRKLWRSMLPAMQETVLPPSEAAHYPG